MPLRVRSWSWSMVEESNPPPGGRTILVTLRFSTSEIADREGHILPGFCADMGWANVPKEGNEVHNLKGLPAPVVFGSIEELPWAVGEALRQAEAVVVRSRPPRKQA